MRDMHGPLSATTRALHVATQLAIKRWKNAWVYDKESEAGTGCADVIWRRVSRDRYLAWPCAQTYGSIGVMAELRPRPIRRRREQRESADKISVLFWRSMKLREKAHGPCSTRIAQTGAGAAPA
jgi:hypothetical protein